MVLMNEYSCSLAWFSRAAGHCYSDINFKIISLVGSSSEWNKRKSRRVELRKVQEANKVSSFVSS